jgi:hypothetical protein
MACEQSEKEYVEAYNAKTRVEEELTPLMLSFVSTPGQPGGVTIPTSEQLQRADHLWKEYSVAEERHRAAMTALIEAKKRHRN